MELQLKIAAQNNYPVQGILIKGAAIKIWIEELQRMHINLEQSDCFPIPNTTPNSIWGCFVLPKQALKSIDIGKHQACQLVHQLLFIPERTTIFPSITVEEMDLILLSKKHLMHPDFGMVELFDAINWVDFLLPIQSQEKQAKKPSSSIFIPNTINSFQVHALSMEEMLEQLEKNSFPQTEKLNHRPLNPTEKARLFFLKKLFKQHQEGEQTFVQKSGLLGKLEAFKNSLTGNKNEQWSNKLQKEYEALEKRNQKELDRLVDLLKDNPEEALKYAVPLDTTGTNRGLFPNDNTNEGIGKLSLRWNNLSLFDKNNNNFSGNGSSSIDDNSFHRLENQYRLTAQQLIQQKKYRKAAFVYLKLLKQYQKAAETLEVGGFYQEAATIYLKYCANKEKAAACYQRGNMYLKAIELYKALNEHELVGDLYLRLNKKEEANFYYNKTVEELKHKKAYIKAALLCKQKIGDLAAAQTLLLEGWRNNSDAFNCLNNYFNNIIDLKFLETELIHIYQNEVNDGNYAAFLRILKLEYKKENQLMNKIRTVAYEIISKQARSNPKVVLELKFFNKKDRHLDKDILRFGLNKTKKT